MRPLAVVSTYRPKVVSADAMSRSCPSRSRVVAMCVLAVEKRGRSRRMFRGVGAVSSLAGAPRRVPLVACTQALMSVRGRFGTGCPKRMRLRSPIHFRRNRTPLRLPLRPARAPNRRCLQFRRTSCRACGLPPRSWRVRQNPPLPPCAARAEYQRVTARAEDLDELSAPPSAALSPSRCGAGGATPPQRPPAAPPR